MINKTLAKRVLQISYENQLSHIGSCLTALPIIEEIYAQKKPDEKFVLSNGHAHLAHLVVMERYGLIQDADALLKQHGIHCDRASGCDVSTGSLGNGLPISVGMALADRTKCVFCVISDGELSEGSIWEALRIMDEQHLRNLKLFINFNGYGAYKSVDINLYKKILVQYRELDITMILSAIDNEQFPFLHGLDAHYHVQSEDEYKQAMEALA